MTDPPQAGWPGPDRQASQSPPGAQPPRASRPPSTPRKKKRPWWQWLLIGFIGLIVLAAVLGQDTSTTTETSEEPVATATDSPTEPAEEGTPTPEPTPKPAEVRREALAAVEDDNFNEALAIIAVLKAKEETRRVRRAITNRLAGRARAVLRTGNRGGARRLLDRAGQYPSTPTFVRASTALRAADHEAQRLRIEAQQRREARRLARQQARQEAAAPPPSTSIPSGPCYSIPQTDFPVPPGDDRDADGDGIACES